jgi:hypothetical protein
MKNPDIKLVKINKYIKLGTILEGLDLYFFTLKLSNTLKVLTIGLVISIITKVTLVLCILDPTYLSIAPITIGSVVEV